MRSIAKRTADGEGGPTRGRPRVSGRESGSEKAGSLTSILSRLSSSALYSFGATASAVRVMSSWFRRGSLDVHDLERLEPRRLDPVRLAGDAAQPVHDEAADRFVEAAARQALDAERAHHVRQRSDAIDGQGCRSSRWTMSCSSNGLARPPISAPMTSLNVTMPTTRAYSLTTSAKPGALRLELR